MAEISQEFWRFARKSVRGGVAALLMSASLAQPIAAQQYPDKPITLIYPFPPGGGGDASIRLIADGLQQRLGVPVVVVNKAGGSGMLGLNTLMQSKPDGYTLAALHNGLTVIRRIAEPGFNADPDTDYAPVAVLWEGVSKLAANPDAPFSTMEELFAYARENPGVATISMGGVGSTDHISAAGLMREAGIDFNLVSYTGSVAAIQAAVSGEVMAAVSAVPLDNQLAARQLVPLGLAVSDPSDLAPGWSGLSSVGIEGFAGLNNWMGLFAPARTSPEIIQTINAALAEIYAEDDLADKVTLLAGAPVKLSAEAVSVKIRDEIDASRDLVGSLDIGF